MAVTVSKYNTYTAYAGASTAGKAQINHDDATSGAFRAVLLRSSYTFSSNHSAYSQLTGPEVSAANYTSGGLVLSSVTYTIGASGTATFDAADVTVTASGTDISAAGAAIRVGGTGQLMFYVDFGQTEIASNGNTFNINWSADGITKIT